MKKVFTQAYILLAALLLLLTVCLPIQPVFAYDVTVTWGNPQPGTVGFKVYYDDDNVDPLNGSGADQGASPIMINDPDQRSITLTNIPFNPTYAAVTAFNSLGQEGSRSSIKRYITIDSAELASEPGTYTAGQTLNLQFNFATASYLHNGNLIVTTNSGAYLVIDPVTFDGWTTQVNFPYVIQAGEYTDPDPLIITNVYLDPNDPDVELYDASGMICTDIAVNLDSDPNNLAVIVVTPGPPAGVSVSCAD